MLTDSTIYHEYLEELKEYHTRSTGDTSRTKGHDAIITTPGKFEGEPCYVLFFWLMYMNGFYDGTFHDSFYEYTYWYLEDEEKQLFRIDGSFTLIVIWENSDGFICHDLLQSLADMPEE
jgi:hypothetical protein